MSTLEIVTVVIAVLVVIGWYLSYTAARLHRLQTRVEGALAALDAHLVRRADAAVELANSGLLDPATSLILASAAAESLDQDDTLTSLDWEEGGLAQRELVESGLTQALRLALPGGQVEAATVSGETDADRPHLRVVGGAFGEDGDDLSPEVTVRRVLDSHRRVRLSRQFYNDAVTDVQRLRRKGVVKTFRLAGHALVPRTVEFDDDLTAGVNS
ncbi:MAG: hypothetical protein Q4G51_10795 [Dermatophilus congolensis]|nr:hypothetical protein [Dermatophilus congolensis]